MARGVPGTGWASWDPWDSVSLPPKFSAFHHRKPRWRYTTRMRGWLYQQLMGLFLRLQWGLLKRDDIAFFDKWAETSGCSGVLGISVSHFGTKAFSPAAVWRRPRIQCFNYRVKPDMVVLNTDMRCFLMFSSQWNKKIFFSSMVLVFPWIQDAALIEAQVFVGWYQPFLVTRFGVNSNATPPCCDPPIPLFILNFQNWSKLDMSTRYNHLVFGRMTLSGQSISKISVPYWMMFQPLNSAIFHFSNVYSWFDIPPKK